MKHIVVIGNGMVGYKFCEKLRTSTDSQVFHVTVFGEEPRPAYDRVHLSEYFSGKEAEEMLLAPRSWYADHLIDLHCGEFIVKINRKEKTIETHRHQVIPYDKLILATGSRPFVPSIPGTDKKGVFVYRTLEDLEAIKQYSKKATRAAVLGGGLLGLEAAKALLDLGLETHVVEFASRLMPRQLDEAGATMLKQELEKLGINIHLSRNTECVSGNGKLDALHFSDGSQLAVDMLVISAGICPRDELAKDAGLQVGPRGGVIVNDHLQSSDPEIYAIGEVALHQNLIYGLVAPGYEMAGVVVDHLNGNSGKIFPGFDMSTKLKLIGIDVASFGDAFGVQEPAKTIHYEDKVKGIYKRINISEDGKVLLGGMLVGDAASYLMLWQMMNSRMPLPPDPEDLILGARGRESEGQGVECLSDDAQVCSCENISKGAICQAVKDNNLQSIKEIKSCTKAGTGCGGCLPMVTDLLNHTLKSMGVRVRKVLCEHFPHTRQELFDIIKVTGIKTFDELLNQYGQGDGCEICKPMVASVLASLWNELVVDQDTIQDTNDRYLANIQKGGTYSVVPRIPGGEITPDKLMAIGRIAKKYGLYTKITGGQRIDMFGAHLHQLPLIWEELIEEGFESGHAYGKALRTVKSCVGSAWCRYGLHDSVSFAIEIENRYKGLRAPHKLKSAVSGCIRECAEAQSKDFGIIATEKGWNLYVCGNGGAKPQHAKLLAQDVDKNTCISYIDRFLMFYIKTAEPLTRTAAWLNKLEGGIDYLRDVVVNDCLGIGNQLEKEMQTTLSVYACEWKEVVKNPVLRAKFKHFINTDEPDPTVRFDSIREQRVPASWKSSNE